MTRRSHPVTLIGLALCALLLLSGCDLLAGLFGGGQDEDPIDIPASVADDPTYDTLENDVFTAINTDRTGHSSSAFAGREASLDALARRYASVGACDTFPGNLVDRVATAMGTCSDATFFLFSSGTAPSADTMMTSWLNNTAGQTAMRSTAFTKIGIGIVNGSGPNGMPGTFVNTVVLLAKP